MPPAEGNGPEAPRASAGRASEPRRAVTERGRAVVQREYRKPLVIEEFDVPAPEPGGLILKITQAGICGSDLHIWHGTAGMALPPGGRAMGHEGNGVVWRLGAGRTTDSLGHPIREGDRVLHSAVHGCGHCYECQRGQPNWCPTYPSERAAGEFPHFVGTFADYYYLPNNHPVYKVPDELPDSVLSFVNCAMGTVTEGLTLAQAGQGHSVVIFGAGGLGLNATAVARQRGVDQVIILDRQRSRLALAQEFGAEHTIDIDEYDTPDARRERVLQLTRGRGADIVMELVGNVSLFPEGLEMLASGGTFVQIGAIGGQSATVPPGVLTRGRRIIGSRMYRNQILPMLMDFLVRQHERLPFEKIISNRYPLEQVNEAFEAAEWRGRQTEVTRAILVP